MSCGSRSEEKWVLHVRLGKVEGMEKIKRLKLGKMRANVEGINVKGEVRAGKGKQGNMSIN